MLLPAFVNVHGHQTPISTVSDISEDHREKQGQLSFQFAAKGRLTFQYFSSPVLDRSHVAEHRTIVMCQPS